MPNIGEFLTGTDPLDSSSREEPVLETTPGQGFEAQWTEIRARGEFVRSRAEISDDLMNWTSVVPSEVSGNAQTVSRGISIAGDAARGFIRIVFEME